MGVPKIAIAGGAVLKGCKEMDPYSIAIILKGRGKEPPMSKQEQPKDLRSMKREMLKGSETYKREYAQNPVIQPHAICPKCGGNGYISNHTSIHECSPEYGDSMIVKSKYFTCLNDECETIIWDSMPDWDIALELGRKGKEE